MLRAVRLAITLGFKLEKNSFAAIKTRAKLLQVVSKERVRMELDKILSSEAGVKNLELLALTGLKKFIPEEFQKKIS
jgi:tRNA nucleotidyltransferase/poly(A) polymerase